jgi:hypothetical protein
MKCQERAATNQEIIKKFTQPGKNIEVAIIFLLRLKLGPY